MNDLKVFEVTDNWRTFRIPLTPNNGLASTYLDMCEWLEENCEGVWKLFEIAHGDKGNSSYGAGSYGRLLQIDLLSDVDIMAFKLRWL